MKTLGFNFYDSGFNILNSYATNDIAEMYIIIDLLMEDEEYFDDWKRSISNCVAEWVFHNWCYNHHIMRKHSADAFIDKELKGVRGTLERIIYYFIEKVVKHICRKKNIIQ